MYRCDVVAAKGRYECAKSKKSKKERVGLTVQMVRRILMFFFTDKPSRVRHFITTERFCCLIF